MWEDVDAAVGASNAETGESGGGVSGLEDGRDLAEKGTTLPRCHLKTNEKKGGIDHGRSIDASSLIPGISWKNLLLPRLSSSSSSFCGGVLAVGAAEDD